jgi:5-methylcytosine-specific restriction endonuclease McrA
MLGDKTKKQKDKDLGRWLNFAKSKNLFSEKPEHITKYRQKKIKQQEKRYLDQEEEYKNQKIDEFAIKSKFNKIPKLYNVNYKQYLSSKEWLQKKQYFLMCYDNNCGVCFRKFKNSDLNLHHLHYKTLGHENWDDLMLVCRGCHGYIHNLNSRPRITY